MGHTLLCVLSLFLLNPLLYYGHAQDRPRATVRPGTTTIPTRGSVTLTCYVDGSEGWRYSWFRRSSESSAAQTIRDDAAQSTVSTSEGGIYHCRGRRGNIFSENSRTVMIEKTVSNRVTVTLQPSWSQIFVGESVIVRCEIQDPGHTGWKYEWQPTNVLTSPTQNQIRISEATLSHSGDYRCRAKGDFYVLTEWSNVVTLTVSHNRPRATVTPGTTTIPVGGSVTLTCSVDDSEGWKYDWFRRNSDSTEAPIKTESTNREIRVSKGGIYRCRGGRGKPVFYTDPSADVSIEITFSNMVTVTQQHDWPQIFSGETITVRCEIQGAGDTEWDYEWRTTRSTTHRTHVNIWTFTASGSSSGDYMCKGRLRGDWYSSTKWSEATTVTVSHQPKPVLTVSPSWLSPGASVTLNCEVEHPSAGWRFYWYKAVPKLPGDSYSYELLPGSSSGTEQDSYMVHGQTHTAGYVCRAGRGDPVFYTQDSELKLVWSADVDPAASLTVSPDRVQHFTSDSVSLSCEGNSTEWRVRRFPEDRSLSCPSWTSMAGSTCKISSSQSSAAVYWCESGSGEFSNSVNITFQNDIILLSPVLPVTEGDPVSLSCKLRTENLRFNVEFYKNDKLVQNDTRLELNTSAVSKSDEGFYRCKVMKESAQSWVSVKLSRREQVSSFLVQLITGLVCGLFLIILLMLLFCYKKSKDSCWSRPSQDSATQQKVNQDEIEVYSSLLHGDVSLYETIRVSANTGRAQPTDESSNITSSVQAGGLDESRGCDDTEENSDYYNVNPAAASGP